MKENIKILERLLSVLKDPPKVEYEATTERGFLAFGPYTITEDEVEVRTIGGTKMLPGFVLTKSYLVRGGPDLPDYPDVEEIGSNLNFAVLACEGVAQLAADFVTAESDRMADEAQAAEYEKQAREAF